MPYIRPEDRKFVEAQGGAGTVGELTYLLSIQCLDYLPDHPRYQDFADVLGALEATKLELYRRAIGPYEDAKRQENGDLPYPHAG